MAATETPERSRLRLGVGAVLVVVVAVLAVTIGVGVWRSAAQPVEQLPAGPAGGSAGERTSDGEEAESGEPAVEAAEVYVHVYGHVNRPGLYVLEAGSRVVDAVAAAGGFSPDAERGAVNLARLLEDGEQLGVPKLGDEPPDGSGADSGSSGDATVDLNDADAATLETLPGVGPAIAERILTWREENGGFASVDDLLAVPGIGTKTLETLRPLVTVS